MPMWEWEEIQTLLRQVKELVFFASDVVVFNFFHLAYH